VCLRAAGGSEGDILHLRRPPTEVVPCILLLAIADLTFQESGS
jgi:hypothetical protein